ncbi:unnamed protein product [Urochloa decumbens]|uniref:F-box domain-containing protein n=1 Tax=Urochloa decumbens TaxID=240449 RepID=A0ABC9E3Y0_9POAL
MDSTAAADEARAAKRARLTPYAAGGDADLISGLDDDVLLRVLGLVPDASDAVRTGALSRRWRGLWARVPALRFASPVSSCGGGAAQRAALVRYAAFVNGVLARRSRSGCAIESLSIVYNTTGSKSDEHSLEQQPIMPAPVNPATVLTCPTVRETEREMQQLMPACVDAAQGWIRNAFRYGVKSFFLDLRLPPNFSGEHSGGGHEILLDGLPSPVTLETMRVALGDARLRVPSTVKFASLVALSLERIEIAAGGAHLLGRLVSSASCPCLQKLCMRMIYLRAFDEEMRLEADVLSELWMEDVHVVRSLKLRTPSLRVFHIYKCSQEMLTISAPRLEELAISFQLYPLRWVEVVNGGLSFVRSLKICLWSHCSCVSCHRDAENDTNILLLKKCSSLTCLDVTLYGGLEAFEEDEDMIKSRVPQLPHITSLTVNVSNWFERHDFGAGIASLLTRFRNLRHLIVHLPIFLSLDYNLREGLDLLCDHQDHWESNEISMAYLQELELTGFTGTECELWFIKAILTSTKSVSRVAISFNKDCCQHQDKMDAFEQMLLGGGMQTSYRDTHRLTCLK